MNYVGYGKEVALMVKTYANFNLIKAASVLNVNFTLYISSRLLKTNYII
jgi:hypothetical protein